MQDASTVSSSWASARPTSIARVPTTSGSGAFLRCSRPAKPTSRRTKKYIYDTTLLGYGKGGHDFGDHLSPDERRALLEYLKTL